MKARFTTRVNARDGPSTQDNIKFTKNNGDIVNVIDIIDNDDRKWVKFNEGGETYYCCFEDEDNSRYAILFEDNNSNNNSNCPMLQKNSSYGAVRKEGCCFLCACYLGGLNNIEEADDCFEWATQEGKVRAEDSYVKIDKYTLASQIATKYNRTKREGNIVKGKNHFYVTDSNGNEIFNSAGPGYGH